MSIIKKRCALAFKGMSILFLVVVATACVPVFRNEYISPQWQGQIVVINSASEKRVVRIEEVFTGAIEELMVVGNQIPHFHFSANSEMAYFKLPAASMADEFSLDFKIDDISLGLTQLMNAVSVSPQLVDVGVIILDFNAYEAVQVPPAAIKVLMASASSICQKRLSDALYWAHVAKNINTGAYSQTGMALDQNLIDIYFERTNEQLYFAERECFQRDYKKMQEFRRFIDSVQGGFTQ